MRSSIASVTLAVAAIACGTGNDETVEGARAQCAYGGALVDCPPAERTSEGACWRMVDCGAIPVSSDDDGVFDWGNCVDGLDRLTEDRRQLVIACIAHSICDELRVSGSPDRPNPGEIPCLRFGAD